MKIHFLGITLFLSLFLSGFEIWANIALADDEVAINSITLSPAGHIQAGQDVTVTANAAGSAGQTISYKFYYCANYGTDDYLTTPWTVVQDYSSNNSAVYNFPAAGNYVIVVRAVTDPTHEPTALPIIGQTVVVGDDSQVSLVGMSADVTTETNPGDTVTVTATAVGPAGQQLYYQFYYCANYGTPSYANTQWNLVQPYSTNNTCQYTFPADGNYIVVARAVTDPSNEPAALPIVGSAVTIGSPPPHVGMPSGFAVNFGGQGIDNGSSVQQTADGGYIVVGTTSSYGAGGTDVYLIKTDGSGNESWSKTFGGTADDIGNFVQQTSDGGYIIVGSTFSSGAGEDDVYLIKTDGSGNESWSKTFGGSEWEEGAAVQQTSDGGYIVVGTTSAVSCDDTNIYLIKTDGNGNETWSKTFGGSQSENGAAVQQTSDGGYIIAGTTWSYGAGGGDVYLVKTDGNGNETWSKAFGTANLEFGRSVQQTSDGGFIIIGNTFDDFNMYLIKTDGNGNESWSKTFGGSEGEEGAAVQQTSDGGYILVGSTTSFNASEYIYLVKTDGNGNMSWSRTYGGTDGGTGSSVRQTSDGGYVIAGSTPLMHFVNGGNETTSGGDVYLIKTDGNGN